MGGGGSDVGQLPVFDLGPFLEKCVVKGEDVDEELKKQCVALAQCLKDTSALVVKDPRCPSHDNATFLNMLEKYYAQPGESRSSASRSPRGFASVRPLTFLVFLPLLRRHPRLGNEQRT